MKGNQNKTPQHSTVGVACDMEFDIKTKSNKWQEIWPHTIFFAAERCWPSNLFLLEMILLESASSDCANKIGFLVTGLLDVCT